MSDRELVELAYGVAKWLESLANGQQDREHGLTVLKSTLAALEHLIETDNKSDDIPF